MPIRFLTDPLGVAILAGTDGLGLIVLAKPTALRPRPPTLGPSMIAQLETMEEGSIRQLRPAAYERCRHLEGLDLVKRDDAGGWILTELGRAWLLEHRRRDLGRETHRRRHDAAVLEAVRAGVARVGDIALRVQLTKEEVWNIMTRLQRAEQVEKAPVGWRAVAPRLAAVRAPVANGRAGW